MILLNKSFIVQAYKAPTSIDIGQFKENLTAPIAFIDDDLEEDGVLGL